MKTATFNLIKRDIESGLTKLDRRTFGKGMVVSYIFNETEFNVTDFTEKQKAYLDDKMLEVNKDVITELEIVLAYLLKEEAACTSDLDANKYWEIARKTNVKLGHLKGEFKALPIFEEN